MTGTDWIDLSNRLFIGYFFALNGVYLALNIVALMSVGRTRPLKAVEQMPQVYSGFETPITIIVPAFNEAASIDSSVRSLLQLNYPDYEIIVVNDGSSDATLARLIGEFDLRLFPEAYCPVLETEPVHGFYVSKRYPNLRVIDKVNGGKADALNVGINAARYPLFCAVDADSILERDSLRRVVQPFLTNPATIATGGTIRILNGCSVHAGYVTNVGLSSRRLVILQVIEYLRAFHFGRLGWNGLNAVLIISGAFGLFRKQAVISVGGYRRQTIGEDMELIVRLHRVYRQRRTPYKITFVAETSCWTEAPETIAQLKTQRARWQRGLAESLSLNHKLLFHRHGGIIGWFVFPFYLVFELLGPVIETVGYLVMFCLFLLGHIDWTVLGLFLLVAIGLGMVLSVSALLLDEMSQPTYPEPRHLLVLVVAAFVENFGFRQMNMLFRLLGLWQWLRGSRHHWGQMQRVVNWQAKETQ